MTLWSFFFAGNIGVEVISQEDYFEPAAQFNWLLHLWSLGVEEQFYLLFPFLMLLILKTRVGRRSTWTPIAWVASLALLSLLFASANELEVSVFGSQTLSEATGVSALLGYYSPITRAWQFGVGIIAALLTLWKPTQSASRVLPLAGVLLLTGSLALMPKSNLLPGPATIVPMAAIFLLLLYPLPTSITSSNLLRPLGWLGDRSYSAYLWHWPVWSVFTKLGVSNVLAIVGSFAVTLILSAATYRLVERPLISRYRGSEQESNNVPSSRPTPKAFLALFLVSPLVLGAAAFSTETLLRAGGLIGQRTEVPRINPALDCIQTDCDGLEVDVLLVGDSHAGALANALSEDLGLFGLSMKSAVVARNFGCLHLPSTVITSEDVECRELATKVRDIIENTSPKWVVLYGYTAGRFTTINSGGEQEIGLIDARTDTPITSATSVSAYKSALEETVQLITEKSSASIVIVSGTPDFTLRPEDVGQSGQPATLAEVLWSPFSGNKSGQSVTRDEFDRRHGPFIQVERNLASELTAVTVVDSWSALCEPNECSQVDEAGELLFADQDHISQRGAETLAPKVAIALSR
jgi:peptidoglycan/LPS O-acetylase OafA/YrhL